MRLAVISVGFVTGACASGPTAGPVGDGGLQPPAITSVDSTTPPRHASVQIDRAGYVALLLVAPGHSATLLFPADSQANNRFDAGTHRLSFEIPGGLAPSDSNRLQRVRRDTMRIGPRRTGTRRSIDPIPPDTPTFLLAVTSSQPLDRTRILEKTAGVSIPTLEAEALNAVGKAIKSTIANEPREWAGYFRVVELYRPR